MTLNFGQNLFPQRRNSLINFDYIDTLTGQGYVFFDLATATDSSGSATKVLTTQEIDSDTVATTYTNNTESQAWVQSGDDDFDFLIQVGQNLKGKVLVEFLNTYKEDIETNNSKAYIRVRLRKWDGTTETEIAAGRTADMSSSGTARIELRHLVEMEVATQVRFNQGETLRITVETWTWCDDAGGGTENITVSYYHDPSTRRIFDVENHDGSSSDETFKGLKTNFRVLIPFKIQFE